MLGVTYYRIWWKFQVQICNRHFEPELREQNSCKVAMKYIFGLYYRLCSIVKLIKILNFIQYRFLYTPYVGFYLPRVHGFTQPQAGCGYILHCTRANVIVRLIDLSALNFEESPIKRVISVAENWLHSVDSIYRPIHGPLGTPLSARRLASLKAKVTRENRLLKRQMSSL